VLQLQIKIHHRHTDPTDVKNGHGNVNNGRHGYSYIFWRRGYNLGGNGYERRLGLQDLGMKYPTTVIPARSSLTYTVDAVELVHGRLMYADIGLLSLSHHLTGSTRLYLSNMAHHLHQHVRGFLHRGYPPRHVP
jgi:hypothetical protein